MLSSLMLLAFQVPDDLNFDPNNAPGGGGGGIMGALCGGVGSLFCFAIIFAIALIPLIGMWKLFEKAGKPGWAAIVPIYNAYVLTEIAGMDIMWFFFTFVPCLNIVAAVMIWINVAKNFGKDTGYAIGIILLPIVFIPLLGFSDARYTPMKH
ncbi:DUF5684 domain-containing protein [Anatilimnocola floriformis]|uniref:DUF5684 domain-containing protein n=1 Tax=Anatilimnocola floriformis TaxID=2948575 RepID=UPI0020C402E7|nr:DUF5684 domain-containing protein [Anatilimnocola floriformis]